MKTLVKFLAVLFLVSAFTALIPKQASSHHKVVISFQVFYDELTPYGTWVYHPVHGYAWIPDTGPDFYPYASDGYWVLTWAGWTWVSNYTWGWAPFHYGRWYMDPFYGPMWIPGYEWGPGWVVWRKSGDYYGWAPIGPGVSINVVYGNTYYIPYDNWRFLDGHHFGTHDQYYHYAHVSDNRKFMEHSNVIRQVRNDQSNYTPYHAGPDRKEIERYRGEAISQVTIQERDKPGQYHDRNKLELYTPEIRKDESTARKAAPSQVTKFGEVKGKTTRTSTDMNRAMNDLSTYREPVRSQQGTAVKKTETVKQTQRTTPTRNTETVEWSAQTASARNAGNVKPTSQTASQRNTGTVNQTSRNTTVKKTESTRQTKPNAPDTRQQAGRTSQSVKNTKSK